jgi:diacylglycerol kinase (ATP)
MLCSLPMRDPKKTLVLLNPKAGSAASIQAIELAIRSAPDTVLHETTRAGEAGELAAAAVREGHVGRVIAGGGDGTVSEIVNALANSHVALGILPLGTGNDLARTLGIPLDDLSAALAIAQTGNVRPMDLVLAEADDKPPTYVANVAAGGFSGQVDEQLDDDEKKRWGPLAYLWSAMKVLPDLTGFDTTFSWSDGTQERVQALNVIIANGRTIAGGWAVAPKAEIDDGLIDVVIVKFGSALDLTAIAARLVAGDYLDSADVDHRRVRSVRVEATPEMWFNVDGELLTKRPIAFRIVPGALRVVAVF